MTSLATPGRHWLPYRAVITMVQHRVLSTARYLSLAAARPLFNTVQVYDVASNTWSAGTSAPNDFLLAGYQQVGQYLYVVGGFEAAGPNRAIAARTSVLSGDHSEAPDANNATTLRLDMASAPGHGPQVLRSPRRGQTSVWLTMLERVNCTLSVGRSTGGGFFDSTNLVDELSVASWPAGQLDSITTTESVTAEPPGQPGRVLRSGTDLECRRPGWIDLPVPL